MRLIDPRGFLARSAAVGSEVTTWGLPAWDVHHEALLLARSVRRHEDDMSATEVHKLMQDEPSALRSVLPAFAAAMSPSTGPTTVATDYLGFRHVFHGTRHGTGAVSTSSAACADALGAGLDLEAVAVQSVLGWQLDQRTLFEGVSKLPPGAVATLESGRVHVSSYAAPATPERLDLDHAVRAAADVLRTYLTTYLEDHPDAGLQLTGGQDSRLLLSAIPPALRRGLRVVTLGAVDEPDVTIAAALASRYGMRHELLSMAGLEDLDPAEAHVLCMDAARRLDFSADPIAHAALTFAEARSEPGPRISGLGGEVCRGFYYLGLPTRAPVSRSRARRLARWRMFVNESVPVEALDTQFAACAREFAMAEVERVLRATGRPWMAATDELYLQHRMQRWAGVTETAICLDRAVVNPMLDDRFITLATGLEPVHKRNSQFLSRVQLDLDAELGALPLDGRPAPAAYAHRSVENSARRSAATMEKAGSKVLQRVRRRTRPPAGGEVLAAKVVSHWREDPAVLEPLFHLRVVDERWLDSLAGGKLAPPSSAVAMVVNLVGAVGGARRP